MRRFLLLPLLAACHPQELPLGLENGWLGGQAPAFAMMVQSTPAEVPDALRLRFGRASVQDVLGDWHTVSRGPYDLDMIGAGDAMEAALAHVRPGDFECIRIEIEEAVAERNGEYVPVYVPADALDGVDVPTRFAAEPGKLVRVVVDFDLNASLLPQGDGYLLTPVFSVVETSTEAYELLLEE